MTPVDTRLITANGLSLDIGYYIALLLVSKIGDVRRFPDSEKLYSYAGLVLWVRKSGSTPHHGGLTREGSKWPQLALTHTVHIHLRSETNLIRFYRRLAKTKLKQVVVTVTARKMLKTVYWMLRNNDT